MPVLDSAPPRLPGRPAVLDYGRRPPPAPPRGRDDRDPGPRWESGDPSFSNARLAMLMLFFGESMFFGALVAAFLHLRLHATVWPPPGQPRLPVGLTLLNTVVLGISSYAMVRAVRAIRSGDVHGLLTWLAGAGVLGGVFLAVQGFEWARLIHFGLTVSSGIYGATFYTLIGVHGAHVVGAVTWLCVTLWGGARGWYAPRTHTGVVCCAMYWHFVVVVWPILYTLVYLI